MSSSLQTSYTSSRRSSTPPTPPCSPSSLKSSLELASFQGNLEQARDILQTWTSIPSLPLPTPDDLSTALNLAVSYGHISTIQLLLDHGAPISTSTAAFASRSDKPNTLAVYESFLQHGWNVSSPADKDGKIMAMNLIMSHPEAETLLQWFLTNGASADGLPANFGSPLRAAIISAPTPALASLLISHGATLKHTSALHAAAASRHSDEASITLMNYLLDAGADIDELEYEGRAGLPRSAVHVDWGTALHTVAKEGSVQRARLLVEKGADMGKRSKWDYTARDRAQLSGREDVKACLEGVMRERGMEVKDIEIGEEGSEDDE